MNNDSVNELPGLIETAAKVEPAPSRGWFKVMRGEEALELIALNPNAFILLFFIASRARRSHVFHHLKLQPGEAFVGDHANMGMTMQEYRTAKEQLYNNSFATFRVTNRGTIAKLIDTRVFDINIEPNNNPANTTSIGEQIPSNKPATSNKEGKKNKTKESTKAPAALVEIPIPDSLNTAEFSTAWEAWQGFRRRIKKPLDIVGAKFQLEDFEKIGPAAAIQEIRKSMKNGWQGVAFEGRQDQKSAQPIFKSQPILYPPGTQDHEKMD